MQPDFFFEKNELKCYYDEYGEWGDKRKKKIREENEIKRSHREIYMLEGGFQFPVFENSFVWKTFAQTDSNEFTILFLKVVCIAHNTH